jgi:hypothetical protein
MGFTRASNVVQSTVVDNSDYEETASKKAAVPKKLQQQSQSKTAV